MRGVERWTKLLSAASLAALVSACAGVPHDASLPITDPNEHFNRGVLHVNQVVLDPPATVIKSVPGVIRDRFQDLDANLKEPRVFANDVLQGRFRAAGITVATGLLEAEAKDTLLGFANRIPLGRPMVTLKLASTLDGRIATRTGESQWITAEPARRAAHGMRGRHDAVMVGVGTVVADDPDLTCRLPGVRPNSLVRVVADSRLRTPLTARLVATAGATPTWFVHRPGADPERARALGAIGARLIEVPGGPVGIDLAAALAAMAEAGINTLMVEGGAQLAAALLRADLVDRIAWFHAPAVMGGDGWPSAQAFGVETLAAMPRYVRRSAAPVGGDLLTMLHRA